MTNIVEGYFPRGYCPGYCPEGYCSRIAGIRGLNMDYFNIDNDTSDSNPRREDHMACRILAAVYTTRHPNIYDSLHITQQRVDKIDSIMASFLGIYRILLNSASSSLGFV